MSESIKHRVHSLELFKLIFHFHGGQQQQQPHSHSTSHTLGLLRPLLASPWNVHVMPAAAPPPPAAASEVLANVHQMVLASIQHQSGQTSTHQQLPQRSHYFHNSQQRANSGSKKNFGQNRWEQVFFHKGLNLITWSLKKT